MKSAGNDRYKKGWTLDIKNQSWVENTPQQVDFLVEKLGLIGNERILDLACGFGRHSLELAKRGYSVVGVDITPAYVEDANKNACELGLNANFICTDIREINFTNEFDVVLNMGDGAIGYLENDEENLKIFDVISKALKVGGKHFMDIMSADYADSHFPAKLWDDGEKGLTLSLFEWDSETKIMLYGQLDTMYGDSLAKPEFVYGNPTRLYHMAEIEKIMLERGMKVFDSYCDVNGNPANSNRIQMLVCSKKTL